MWETREKYAIVLSNEKTKIAGGDINRYRNKKRKPNEKRNLNEQKKAKTNIIVGRSDFPPKRKATGSAPLHQVEEHWVRSIPKTLPDNALSRKVINSRESADQKSMNLGSDQSTQNPCEPTSNKQRKQNKQQNQRNL